MRILINEQLSEHKYKTPEGYLICTDAIIARTGKQEYRRNEIFTDSDDDSIIELDRPSKEVFSDKTIASFENKPLVNEHPDEDVNTENYKEYAVGFIRDVHKGTVNGQDVLLANLVFTDKDAIDDIESGRKTELSCGYDCDIIDEENPKQVNIRGNHVALCERGRAGIAKIVDSIKDTICDAYYLIGYRSKNDKNLKEDISEAKKRGLKTSLEKIAENFQLRVEGNKEILRDFVENYLGLDSSVITDSIKDDIDNKIAKIRIEYDRHQKLWCACALNSNGYVITDYIYGPTKEYVKEDAKKWKIGQITTEVYDSMKDSKGWVVLDPETQDIIEVKTRAQAVALAKKLSKQYGHIEIQIQSYDDNWDEGYSSNSKIEYITDSIDEKESKAVREAIALLEGALARKNGYKLSRNEIEIIGGSKFPISTLVYNRLCELGYDKDSISDSIKDDRFIYVWVDKKDIKKPKYDVFEYAKATDVDVTDLGTEYRFEGEYSDVDYLFDMLNLDVNDYDFDDSISDSIKDVEPRADESKDEFISRFMSETENEYPDEKQRLAVAYSYWEKKDSVKDRDPYKVQSRELKKEAKDYTKGEIEMHDEVVRTPRGTFQLVNESEESLRKRGYAFHHISEDGKYKIMTNSKQNSAVAIINVDYRDSINDANELSAKSIDDLDEQIKRYQKLHPTWKFGEIRKERGLYRVDVITDSVKDAYVIKHKKKDYYKGKGPYTQFVPSLEYAKRFNSYMEAEREIAGADSSWKETWEIVKVKDSVKDSKVLKAVNAIKLFKKHKDATPGTFGLEPNTTKGYRNIGSKEEAEELIRKSGKKYNKVLKAAGLEEYHYFNGDKKVAIYRTREKDLEFIDSKVKDDDQTDVIKEIKSNFPNARITNIAKRGKVISFDVESESDSKYSLESFINRTLTKYNYKIIRLNTIKNKIEVIANKNDSIKDTKNDWQLVKVNEGFKFKHKSGKLYSIWFKNESDAKNYINVHLGEMENWIENKPKDSKVKDDDWAFMRKLKEVSQKDLLNGLKKVCKGIQYKELTENGTRVQIGNLRSLGADQKEKLLKVLNIVDSVKDDRFGEVRKVANKNEIIRGLKSIRLDNQEDDLWLSDGTYDAQIQNRGQTIHELRKGVNKISEKEASWALGRIWKNKSMIFREEGPVNVVRDKMIKYLQTTKDSVKDNDQTDIIREIKSTIPNIRITNIAKRENAISFDIVELESDRKYSLEIIINRILTKHNYKIVHLNTIKNKIEVIANKNDSVKNVYYIVAYHEGDYWYNEQGKPDVFKKAKRFKTYEEASRYKNQISPELASVQKITW